MLFLLNDDKKEFHYFATIYEYICTHKLNPNIDLSLELNKTAKSSDNQNERDVIMDYMYHYLSKNAKTFDDIGTIMTQNRIDLMYNFLRQIMQDYIDGKAEIKANDLAIFNDNELQESFLRLNKGILPNAPEED